MAEHTILLVDQDTALSDRIGAALAPYGCRAVLLTDPAGVLSYPLVPSLIVLCIDPKKAGWQTLSAIRKHPVLRSVPLIVTSAEATDADFEQHKKLKWRADEYERKPLSIDRVVDKARALLGGLEVQVSGEFELPPPSDNEEVVVIDDGADEGEERTRVAGPSDMLVLDTDAAFASIAAPPDELVSPSQLPAQVAPAGGLAVAPRAVEPAPLPDFALDEHTASREPVTITDEVEDTQALPARRDAIPEPLRDEPRSRSGSTVSTPRELLGLREQIVRKDRELLELREQMDGKEHEALAAREKLRESERTRRELDERILTVERELVGADERIDALTRDGELAQHREQGLKSRLEDALKKAERTQADADSWRTRHAAEVEAVGAAVGEREALRVELAAARAEHAEEKRALQGEKEAAEASHKAAHDTLAARIEEAAQAHAAELSRLRDQHAAGIAELEGTHEQEIASLGSRHESAAGEWAEAHQAALAEEKQRQQAAITALEQRHQAALETARAEHQAAIEKATQEHEQAQAQLTAERDAAQAERDTAHQETREAEARHAEAQASLRKEHDEALSALRAGHGSAVDALRDEHKQALDALRAEHADAQRRATEERQRAAEQETARAAATAQSHAAELDELKARLEKAESENASLQEQVLRAYHRLRSDEQVVSRAKKAIAIALTLLDANLPAPEDKPSS